MTWFDIVRCTTGLTWSLRDVFLFDKVSPVQLSRSIEARNSNPIRISVDTMHLRSLDSKTFRLQDSHIGHIWSHHSYIFLPRTFIASGLSKTTEKWAHSHHGLPGISHIFFRHPILTDCTYPCMTFGFVQVNESISSLQLAFAKPLLKCVLKAGSGIRISSSFHGLVDIWISNCQSSCFSYGVSELSFTLESWSRIHGSRKHSATKTRPIRLLLPMEDCPGCALPSPPSRYPTLQRRNHEESRPSEAHAWTSRSSSYKSKRAGAHLWNEQIHGLTASHSISHLELWCCIEPIAFLSKGIKSCFW